MPGTIKVTDSPSFGAAPAALGVADRHDASAPIAASTNINKHANNQQHYCCVSDYTSRHIKCNNEDAQGRFRYTRFVCIPVRMVALRRH